MYEDLVKRLRADVGIDGRADMMKEAADAIEELSKLPAADVVDEENVLKFYYVRSTDDYWIGQRVDNFYYAEFDPEALQWTWTHSRYLPWGEHVVSPTSLWKEHTYPSKPEEMPFEEWLRGLIKKYFPAADVRPVVKAKWEQVNIMFSKNMDNEMRDSLAVATMFCPKCKRYHNEVYIYGDPTEMVRFCPNCGADMREES